MSDFTDDMGLFRDDFDRLREGVVKDRREVKTVDDFIDSCHWDKLQALMATMNYSKAYGVPRTRESMKDAIRWMLKQIDILEDENGILYPKPVIKLKDGAPPVSGARKTE